MIGDFATSLWTGLTSNPRLAASAVALALVVYVARGWALPRLGAGGALRDREGWVIAGALLGGRAFAVAQEFERYLDHPLDILLVNQGVSFFGALAGGAFTLLLIARAHRVGYLRLLDAFALALPLGIAAYRLSCVAYGLCGGKPAPFPFGVPLPGHFGPRYPSELIEGALVLGLFAALLWSSGRTIRPGLLAGLFLVAYPFVRALVDLTRFLTGPLPWNDPVLSLLTVLVGAVLLVLAPPNRAALGQHAAAKSNGSYPSAARPT